jgi:hypothetical protein
VLIAAPLASYIPLAALASVLVVVAWNMAEKHEFVTLIRSSRGDATVLLATFLLTIFRGLTEGILVGFALGAVLFINRMAQMIGIAAATPLVTDDVAITQTAIGCPTIPVWPPTPTSWCTVSPGHFSSVWHRRWGRCSTASPMPARRSWSISPRCHFWIPPRPTR